MHLFDFWGAHLGLKDIGDDDKNGVDYSSGRNPEKPRH